MRLLCVAAARRLDVESQVALGQYSVRAQVSEPADEAQADGDLLAVAP